MLSGIWGLHNGDSSVGPSLGPGRGPAGLACIEGVRTPSLVAKAVAELTNHHSIGGRGASEFGRSRGFEIEDNLDTEQSRALWLEWKRSIDPGQWLNPAELSRSPSDDHADGPHLPNAVRLESDAPQGIELVLER